MFISYLEDALCVESGQLVGLISLNGAGNQRIINELLNC